jgi:hypothetical protein
MPNSRKRKVKTVQEDRVPVTKNPLHYKWAKIILLILVSGFALSGLVSLIYVFVQIAKM